jgi:hypothetical protein
MKRLILPGVILSVLFFVGSCYYDREEALYPSYNASCDTTNITFSTTITTVLSNSCWSCHSASNAATFGNNIKLVSYTDVSSQITTVITSINHTSSKPMPKNAPKLPACQLNQFDIWVKKGMPNN